MKAYESGITKKQFVTETGIPKWLYIVHDRIFEGVSIERSKVWPVEFVEAINKGSNLDDIKTSFIIYILEQNIKIQKKAACVVDMATTYEKYADRLLQLIRECK